MAFQLYIVDMHDLNIILWCAKTIYISVALIGTLLLSHAFLCIILVLFYAHFGISIGLIYAMCTKAFLLVNG